MMRYLIKCTVFDGYGEDDYYELEAETLEEAECIADREEFEDEVDGSAVTTEIVDRNILGVVLPGSRYAKPGIVYKEATE